MYRHLYRQCPRGHYPYIIQPGDTLARIAARLEVDLERIIAANPGINPYNLQIGQVICIPACLPNHIPYIIKPGDTLYKIAQEYNTSIDAILMANPGIDPKYLRVGQRICIPLSIPEVCQEIVAAMQRDIDKLIEESNVQQISESNYGNSTLTTEVREVTDTQIQFDAVPIFFTGDYRGRFTVGRRYPYYTEAAMGGQRGIVVKDNFGVWHSFGYRLQIAQQNSQ